MPATLTPPQAIPPVPAAGHVAPVAELLGGIVGDVQTLIKQQAQMLRAEIREDFNRGKAASVYIGTGLGLAAVGTLFLVVGLVYLLQYLTALPPFACLADCRRAVGRRRSGGRLRRQENLREVQPAPGQDLQRPHGEPVVADEQSPEVIEQDMAVTRSSLVDKIAAWNPRWWPPSRATSAVQDTVQSVTSAVHDTTSSVRESLLGVQDDAKTAIHGLTDNVKEAFDVTSHVRDNPVVMLAGATVAGFVTGLLAFGKATRSLPGRMDEGSEPPPYRPSYAAGYAARPPRKPRHRPARPGGRGGWTSCSPGPGRRSSSSASKR